MTHRCPITTHVLDTATGRPAQGLEVILDRRTPEGHWQTLGEGHTDADGRIGDLVDLPILEADVYRLTFHTGAWFAHMGQQSFYPEVKVCFEITRPDQHHHVPLLLSPFGYSTYRGS